MELSMLGPRSMGHDAEHKVPDYVAIVSTKLGKGCIKRSIVVDHAVLSLVCSFVLPFCNVIC